MKPPVRAIPEGYHSVTPYLIIKNAANAIEFYKKAFDAKEVFCMKSNDGKVKHAEIQIGNSRVMLADEYPEMNVFGPDASGRAPIMIHLYVEDVDHTFKKAVDAGASVIRPLANQFYGDRSAFLKDPYGHSWGIATHIEDLSAEEITERAKSVNVK
ncbi:MAG TPA: VOC family protein [Gammaproteobacteria bacterium]|nr:VOC family protein [Gammaproteobacteria bacterium]